MRVLFRVGRAGLARTALEYHVSPPRSFGTPVAVLRVIDIETTGFSPPAEIIEIGRVDVVGTREMGWTIERPLSRLYRPRDGIPPETKAVHHITEASIPTNAELCTPANIRSAVMHPIRPDVLVAHNCAFERTFIGEEATDGLPWICTYKSALRLWPDAPAHSNQVLRYWRELTLDEAYAMPPHRAAPDAWVTAHLLVDMLRLASIEQLVNWTGDPKLLPTMPFGEHRGKKWEEVPTDYLNWIGRQKQMDSDVVWNARQEISRRRQQ